MKCKAIDGSVLVRFFKRDQLVEIELSPASSVPISDLADPTSVLVSQMTPRQALRIADALTKAALKAQGIKPCLPMALWSR